MPRPVWSGTISFGLVTSLNQCRSALGGLR